jgi:hypothetical protein
MMTPVNPVTKSASNYTDFVKVAVEIKESTNFTSTSILSFKISRFMSSNCRHSMEQMNPE